MILDEKWKKIKHDYYRDSLKTHVHLYIYKTSCKPKSLLKTLN